MLVLETLFGTRINALPAALDAAAWGPNTIAMRISADDLFVYNDMSSPKDVSVDTILALDEHAIIESETGFCGGWLAPNQLEQVLRQIEWTLPTHRPALAQGFIAGVPAKLWLTDTVPQFGHDTVTAFLLCGRPNVADLLERLGL